MKKLILGIVLFSAHILYCQVHNGNVEYSLSIGHDDRLKRDDDLLFLESARKGADEINFRLVFNDTNSFFSILPYKGIHDEQVRNALVICSCEENFFTDIKNKEVMYPVLSDNFMFKQDEFIIKENILSSWELINETKLINGLTVYKAHYKEVEKNEHGVFVRDIFAWYCPEIPISTGPKGYGGLPGLILELQEGNILFGAQKITLNDELLFDFVKPSKGKIISKKEYNDIIENRIKKFQDSYEN